MLIVSGKKGSYRVQTEPLVPGRADLLRAVDDRGGVVAVRVARGNPVAVRGLADEARTMREVAAAVPDAQRWLVPVLDDGVANGVAFLALPAFERTLREGTRPVEPLADRLALLEQACEAVSQLNQAPLARRAVHRHLTPGAFLVHGHGPEAQVQLTDYGRRGADDRPAVADEPSALRARYAPPEQGLPLHGDPEPTLDVFALGAIAFEALAGGAPPAAALQPAQWLTTAARELIDLWARRDAIGTMLLAHCEKLRAMPIDRLVRFDAAPPLTSAEEERLLAALETAARPAVPRGLSADVAQELARVLLPVLRLALHPDPRERPRHASELVDAFARARDLLERRAAGLPVDLPPPLPMLQPPRAAAPALPSVEPTPSPAPRTAAPPATAPAAAPRVSSHPPERGSAAPSAEAARAPSRSTARPEAPAESPPPADLRRAAKAASKQPGSGTRGLLLAAVALFVVAVVGGGVLVAFQPFGTSEPGAEAPEQVPADAPLAEAPPQAEPAAVEVAPEPTEPTEPTEPAPAAVAAAPAPVERAADAPAPVPKPPTPSPAPAPTLVPAAPKPPPAAAKPAPPPPAPKPVAVAPEAPKPAPAVKAPPEPAPAEPVVVNRPPPPAPKPAPEPVAAKPVTPAPTDNRTKTIVIDGGGTAAAAPTPAPAPAAAPAAALPASLTIRVSTDNAETKLSWLSGGLGRGRISGTLTAGRSAVLQMFVPAADGSTTVLDFKFKADATAGRITASGPGGSVSIPFTPEIGGVSATVRPDGSVTLSGG